MKRVILGGFVLTALFSVGCASSTPDTGSTAAVSDSAGVRVIEHSGAMPARVVVPSLEWRHGHAEGDYLFRFAFMAAFDSDGSVYVGDGGNREVLRITADGSSHEVMAVSGQGPDEVRQPVALVQDPSGGIWVDDIGNAKLLHFESGRLIRSINTSSNYEIATGAMVAGVAESGSLLLVTASFSPGFDEPWLDGHLTRMAPDILELDSVGTFPLMQRQPEEGANPFMGEGRATGAGDGWAQTRTDLPEVVWKNPDGTVRQIVRWNPELRYPDQDVWEAWQAYLQENLVRVNPGIAPERLEMMMERQRSYYALDTSTPLPLFGSHIGASTGDVWLPAFETGRHRHEYAVISSDGMRAALVRFERPVAVIAATSGRVIVNERNEMDVQAIAVYSFNLGW